MSSDGMLWQWNVKPGRKARYQRLLAYWAPRVGLRLAHEQALWEMQRPVIRMRKTGMTFQQIGDAMEVCRDRARQIYLRATRYRTQSPVEKWMQSGGDISELHDKLRTISRREKKRREHGLWMYDLENVA